MEHRGVEFTLVNDGHGFWKCEFRIGNRVIVARVEANLDLLAIRRAKMRIDRELRNLGPKE